MPRALFNGKVVAETDSFEEVEGNVYFPPGAIVKDFLKPSPTTTVCPWKGTASYYTVEVDGKVAEDAAWTYREPKDAAKNIKDHIAFWRGVTVER